MERKSFSDMLVKAREGQKCGKNELCRRAGFTFHQLQRIECASNSYNMTLPIRYLQSLNSYMTCSFNGKEYIVKSYEDIVKYIKDARGGIYTQRSLSEEIGVTQASITNIETGKMVVGADVFLKLANVLNIEIAICLNN